MLNLQAIFRSTQHFIREHKQILIRQYADHLHFLHWRFFLLHCSLGTAVLDFYTDIWERWDTVAYFWVLSWIEVWVYRMGTTILTSEKLNTWVSKCWSRILTCIALFSISKRAVFSHPGLDTNFSFFLSLFGVSTCSE